MNAAAKQVAAGMVNYYTGDRPGDVPGNLPAPYYWWEAGAMFGALIDYWYFTGDDQYNAITMQAMRRNLYTQALLEDSVTLTIVGSRRDPVQALATTC